MSMNYNVLAEKYDLTRVANIDILNRFAQELSLDGINILDFGCGTGNFTCALRKLTSANIYGVEPSDGMREKAVAKGLNVKKGDHTGLPFADNFFDFIYMTDVIHHVPDLYAMFAEFMRVLKPGGHICILTESHEQLGTRFWAKHFPSTVTVERERYPDIPVIIEAAKSASLSSHKTVVTDEEKTVAISEDFIRLVENKGYSMFHLINDEDYDAGLSALKSDYQKGETFTSTHGETLLWLKKAAANDMSITYTAHITVDEYNLLREAVGWGMCKPDRVQVALERSDFLTVAQAGGNSVGMARVVHDGLQALVMDVMVLPAYQGQGIGKALMKNVMKFLDELSQDGGIFVNLMSALGKDGFYEQFGFERRPNDKRGPGMTQWISREGKAL